MKLPADTSLGPPPLHALLLWQTCVLVWIAGLLAPRWPLPALVCLTCICIADSRLWRPVLGALAVGIFALGFWVCQALLPVPEPLPDWAADRTADGTKGIPRFSGVVYSVQGLPDNRLRIILEDVCPVSHSERSEESRKNWKDWILRFAQNDNTRVNDKTGLNDKTGWCVPKIAWTWEQATHTPLPGQCVEVTLPLRAVISTRNPGVGDSAEWWAAQGIFWRVWSRGAAGNPVISGEGRFGAAARAFLEQKVVQALKDQNLTQAQAFIPALLFGDRRYLHTATVERMAGAGLAHSLALSGQHLALAALLALILTYALARCWPTLYLYASRNKIVALASLPPAILYLWLGGAPASLIRAFCMLVIFAFLLWRNTLRTVMDVLFAALLAITVLWPLGVFDTGLTLSVLCVAALALFAPLLRQLGGQFGRWFGHQSRRRLPTPVHDTSTQYLGRPIQKALRVLFQVLLASCLIQVALLPVFLLLFGSISPYFISNVLWLPMLGLIVLPCAALGTLLSAIGADALAQGVLWCATLPCQWLLYVLDTLAHAQAFDTPALLRPHWTALPGWAALITALALMPGRTHYPAAGRRLLAVGALLLCVGPAMRLTYMLFDEVRLTVWDVGQGQAVSMHLPGGRTVLVDGGGGISPRFDTGRAVVAPALTYNAAPRLSHGINSHPDIDHSRGLAYILQSFAVEHFWHNGEKAHTADIQALFAAYPGKSLHAGDALALDNNLWIEVLYPPHDTAFTGNNASLVLRLVRDTKGLVLLAGDAEIPALRALLASGRSLQADVLILPHHGSSGSLLPAFYEAVAPKVALVSCGRDNRYKYPSQEVIRVLAARGVCVYSTAREGALTVVWDRQGKMRKH